MPAVGDPWNDLCQVAFEDFAIPVEAPTHDLYHYTDVTGFKEIIESGQFLATHVRFMADHLEIAYGRALLHRVLLEQASHWKPEQLDAFERALLAMSHTNPGRPTPVYAVSFSEVGDDMAQWDRYANRGVGYSLGFKPTDLATIERTGPFPDEWSELALRRVIYDEARQRGLLQELVKLGIALVDEEMPEWTVADVAGYSTLARYMASPLLELLSSFKHPGFAAEREWRLTYTGGIHESEGFEALFRSSARGMIPYVQFGVPGKPPPRKRMPLSSVVCGPGLSRVEAPLAACGFLLINAYQALSPDVAAANPAASSLFPRVLVQASSVAR